MIATVTAPRQPAEKPGLSTTVQHMAGMLWYQMLSAMNANGLSGDSLGTGGSDFQSMFLWNLAQNDFGKYDAGLLGATTRQLGGAATSSATPSAAPPAPAPAAPQAITQPGQTMPAIASLAPVEIQPLDAPAVAASPDLVAQAKSFARTIWPQITKAAQTLGVPAVAVLAQTALETGWGGAAPGHNLFGIKAVDGEAGSNRATHEVVDGVLTPQSASFRNFASLGDAFNDYIGLIQSGYQSAAGQSTVAGFAQALQAGGYATDQNYAAKIVNIAQSPLMAQVLRAVGDISSQVSPGGTP